MLIFKLLFMAFILLLVFGGGRSNSGLYGPMWTTRDIIEAQRKREAKDKKPPSQD